MPGTRRKDQTFRNREPEFTEELEECPYDSSHRIRPGQRMVRHLVICRKECISNKTNPNHKKALDMKICPYNSSHHVNKKEMDQHVQDCASAALFKDANANLDDFVNLKITTETAKKESSSIEKAKTSGEEEEDWDKEMSGVEWTSYDPMKKVLENNFAVNSKCRNQTERRDIRTMQRIGDKEGLTYLLADGDSINSGPGKKQLPVGMSSKQRK